MYEPTREFARKLDLDDPLAGFRSRFHLPTDDEGQPQIYLCGNSLGLQPTGVADSIEQELEDWAELGVEGHFDGRRPWYSYHEMFAEPLAKIVGAKPAEVVAMNALTVNLHLMMVSFYRPTPQRYKILIEESAFPSDQYAVASQAEFHGLDPSDAIVEASPRAGEQLIRTDDVEAWLEQHGDEVALVLFGGVNYYTGQVFDMERIAKAAHAAGARVGFDLAHAAGNVPLKLHDWGADFAVWCSYKYLNSGPGSVAGCFVHERWEDAPELPRFAGWWGTDPETRFEMKPDFYPQRGAAGWQLSNAPVLTMAAHRASLDLFEEAGMDRLRDKSIELTTYLLWLIDQIDADRFEVITPRALDARGSQLSILTRYDGRALFEELQARDVVCDYREPGVIRVAPVPLYNSFEDVWRFWDVLRETTVAE